MFHRPLLFVAIAAATTLITAAAAQAPGHWTNGAPMPSSRTEVAVAELGGKIYVVGGFSGERELEIYDPAADRWSRGAAFPHEVHHAAAVGLNGKLYVIGGYVQGWTPTNAVYEFDPGSDRWRMLAPMPTSRGALGAAVLAGKIHAVSGVGAGGKNTPTHEMYDPATNVWSVRRPLPTPRDHLAVAALDGRLYAIGGRIDGSYSRNLAVNESYDPAADAWHPRAPLPTARSGIAASVLNGKIIVVGGEAPSGTFNQGSLRSSKRYLERVRSDADSAPRAGQCGRGWKNVCDFGRPSPGCVVLRIERDFHALTESACAFDRWTSFAPSAAEAPGASATGASMPFQKRAYSTSARTTPRSPP